MSEMIPRDSTMGVRGEPKWWQGAVVYQIYPRSFADANGDGIGDLAGIRSRLPYLADLGIDAIWVSPWFVSPFRDGGYDVADYRDIDPMLGTLDDARGLLHDARESGIRVLFDLVPNHTSSDHPWFQAAIAAGAGGPERARYHFRPGRGDDGSMPPNNWKSVFGGPAWTRVADGDWYLHLFDPGQPDLNWSNPEVREEFEDIIRYWIDLGASGFRTDVAHGLAKDPAYGDLDLARGVIPHPFWDRDELHDVVRGWRKVLDSYPDDKVMVAEAWVATLDRHALYQRPDEFHQAFNFFFLDTPWDRMSMRKVISDSIAAAQSVGSLPSWVLSNHDVVRHATRLGLPHDIDAKTWLLDGDRGLLDGKRGLMRARAASLLTLALPGSVYLYQGEELGLPEVHDLPTEILDDPFWARSEMTVKGRDGCRVPIPWTRQPPSFGFGGDEPWLPMPGGWGDLSVEAQSGVEGSTLEMYRRALQVRRDRVGQFDFEWLESGKALSFKSGGLVCVTNFGPENLRLPDGEVVVSSWPLPGDSVAPDTTVWLETD